MIIRSIRLKNYKKYRDAFIEFPEGLFGIVGNNGAGKTSLIEAIAWAIYGNVKSKTGKDLLKREGADPNSDCTVELEFVLGSQAYRVVRALRGKNKTPYAALYVDGTDHTEGVTPVTRYLSHRLGMDHNSFFTSIFAKQKELDALSNLSSGARKKVILRLLRIDSIDTAIKNLHDGEKTLQTNVRILRDGSQNMQELETELDGLKDEEEKQNKKIFLMRNDASKAGIKNDQLKKRLAQQEKNYKKYQQLESKLEISENTKRAETENIEKHEGELRELAQMSNKLDEILPQLESLETKKTKKENLEKIRDKFREKSGFESQITDIDEHIDGLEKELSKIMDKLEESKHLEKQIKEVETEIEKYDARSKNDAKKLEHQRAHLTELEERKVKLSRAFGEIEKLGIKSKCPLCKKIIGEDLYKINEHYTNEIARLDGEMKSCASAIIKLEDAHDVSTGQLRDKKQERSKLDESMRQKTGHISAKKGHDTQIKESNKQRQKIQKKITEIGDIRYDEDEYKNVKELLAHLEELDKERISLKANTSRIPSVEKSIKSSKAKLFKAETNMGNIQNAMETLGFNEKDYGITKAECESANERHHEMEVNLTREEGVLDMIKQKITQHDEQIDDMGKKWEEIAGMEEEIRILNMLDDIFGRFRTELISRIIPNLSVLSSRLFKKITEEKYQKMTLSGDYEILIEDGGKQFPLKRFSGGEEDLASLCLRIAISQIIKEKTGSEGISFIVTV